MELTQKDIDRIKHFRDRYKPWTENSIETIIAFDRIIELAEKYLKGDIK